MYQMNGDCQTVCLYVVTIHPPLRPPPASRPFAPSFSPLPAPPPPPPLVSAIKQIAISERNPHYNRDHCLVLGEEEEEEPHPPPPRVEVALLSVIHLLRQHHCCCCCCLRRNGANSLLHPAYCSSWNGLCICHGIGINHSNVKLKLGEDILCFPAFFFLPSPFFLDMMVKWCGGGWGRRMSEGGGGGWSMVLKLRKTKNAQK